MGVPEFYQGLFQSPKISFIAPPLLSQATLKFSNERYEFISGFGGLAGELNELIVQSSTTNKFNHELNQNIFGLNGFEFELTNGLASKPEKQAKTLSKADLIQTDLPPPPQDNHQLWLELLGQKFLGQSQNLSYHIKPELGIVEIYASQDLSQRLAKSTCFALLPIGMLYQAPSKEPCCVAAHYINAKFISFFENGSYIASAELVAFSADEIHKCVQRFSDILGIKFNTIFTNDEFFSNKFEITSRINSSIKDTQTANLLPPHLIKRSKHNPIRTAILAAIAGLLLGFFACIDEGYMKDYDSDLASLKLSKSILIAEQEKLMGVSKALEQAKQKQAKLLADISLLSSIKLTPRQAQAKAIKKVAQIALKLGIKLVWIKSKNDTILLKTSPSTKPKNAQLKRLLADEFELLGLKDNEIKLRIKNASGLAF